MATKNLETSARRLHGGEIAFNGYTRAVRDEYERIAAMLTRRWVPPGWVEQEDVVQDLFVATWESIWKYDAARGASIGDFVVFNAISRAKRQLHKARGANLHGSSDRNPSRMEVAFSSLGQPDQTRETLDEMISRLSRRLDSGWDGSAEDAAVAAEDGLARVSVILAACSSEVQRKVVSAIAVADADVGRAAEILCRDEGFRAPFGIGAGEVDVMAALADSIARDVVAKARREGAIEKDRLERFTRIEAEIESGRLARAGRDGEGSWVA
jgi:DNA-directed RNA polymerase specialized sigma24 family protein